MIVMYESTVSDTELSDFCEEEEDLEQVYEDARQESIVQLVDFMDHTYYYDLVWEPLHAFYDMDLDQLYRLFTFCEVFVLGKPEASILSRWYSSKSSRVEKNVLDFLCTCCEICHTPINPWTLGNALKYCRI